MLRIPGVRAVAVLATAAVCLGALVPTRSDAATLCDVSNTSTVSNGPTSPTTCTFRTDVTITQIRTYHWNGGAGAAPGTVGLSGPLTGPIIFRNTTGRTDWIAKTNIRVPAGTYTILDSDAATWSQNSGTQGSGFATITGTVAAPAPAVTPSPTPLSHFKCYTIEGAPPHAVVALTDQFKAGVRETLGPAQLLCTPAKKSVLIGNPINVPPTADHLMCYQILPALSPNQSVQIKNQFESKRLNVLNTRLLCAPTVKTVIPKSSG